MDEELKDVAGDEVAAATPMVAGVEVLAAHFFGGRFRLLRDDRRLHVGRRATAARFVTLKGEERG